VRVGTGAWDKRASCTCFPIQHPTMSMQCEFIGSDQNGAFPDTLQCKYILQGHVPDKILEGSNE
jgi:hypothetical protein